MFAYIYIYIYRVDPEELSKNFSAALSNAVLATHVSCRFILHSALNTRNGANEDSEDTNLVVRDIGNVTAETEHTFEFAPGDKLKNYKNLSKVPFQLQINYKRLDGMRYKNLNNFDNPNNSIIYIYI